MERLCRGVKIWLSCGCGCRRGSDCGCVNGCVHGCVRRCVGRCMGRCGDGSGCRGGENEVVVGSSSGTLGRVGAGGGWLVLR